MLNDRSFLAASLSLTLIALMGFYRPRDWNIGVPEEAISAQRMLWSQQFDMVIGGDSRTHLDVDPSALNRALQHPRRVANFGFDSVGYNTAYLDHLERLLDKTSPCKTIVLGMTPRTLTPVTQQKNQYLYLRQTPASRQYLNLYLSQWLHFFRPYNLKALFFEPNTGNFAIRKPDGWIGAWRIPADESLAVTLYEKAFLNNKVSQKVENDFLNRIRQWRSLGIAVFAFKPPISQGLQALEDQTSGFDESAFIQKFRDAGGIWLETDADKKFTTYDGSHLPALQAVPFSAELGRTMAQSQSLPPCH